MTTALYAAGYGSSSRGRRHGLAGPDSEDVTVEAPWPRASVYTIASSPLGRMLIAATTSAPPILPTPINKLQQEMIREFPFATRRRDDAPMALAT